MNIISSFTFHNLGFERLKQSKALQEWITVILLYSSIVLFVYGVGTWWQPAVTVINDFRNRIYYIPGKRECQKHVVLSDQTLIHEVSEAPELSQRAVYGEMFGFDVTLGKMDNSEVKLARTRLFRRVLQMHGVRELKASFPKHVKVVEGHLPYDAINEWKDIRLKDFCEGAMFDFYSRIFFGDALCHDADFGRAIKRFPRDLISTMTCLKATPGFMRRPLINWITDRGAARETATAAMSKYLEEGSASLAESGTFLSMMKEATSDNREYWTPQVLTQALMGIWLAAAFQPFNYLFFTILALCERPEYVEPLREEFAASGELTYDTLMSLPFLDSFTKEAARYRPLDTMNVRRRALQPLTLSTGQHIPKGAIACVDSAKFLSDEANYPDPARFDGSRFVQNMTADASTPNAGSLTDISRTFPIWGFGSLACPGRFHAAFSIKLVVALLVSRYDFKLTNSSKSAYFTWDTFTLAKGSTKVSIRRRQSA